MSSTRPRSYLSSTPLILGLSKVFVLALAQIPVVRAAPIHASTWLSTFKDEGEGKDEGDMQLWLYLSFAAALVLLGGAFAGLTIALMGQVSCILPEKQQ